MAELAESWADGELDRGSWVAAQRRLTERLLDAQRRLAPGKVDVVASVLGEGALAERWPSMRFDQQRAVLAGLVERVTVSPAVWGRNRFDPGRVHVTWLW